MVINIQTGSLSWHVKQQGWTVK